MAGVLNLEKGFVFIHVPKCAGASMTSVLMQLGHSLSFRDLPGLEAIVEAENAASAERINLALHARASDIRTFLGADVYDGLESFAVVRNPWERLKSRYHFFRGLPAHPMHEFARGSLGDFIRWVCANRPGTMHERLADRSGRLMVKSILKFESLEEDFKRISRRLSLGIDKLPHRNPSTKTPGDPGLPEDVVGLVERTYEKDFSLFEYPVEPPGPC